MLHAEHHQTSAQLLHLGVAELNAYDGPIRDYVRLVGHMKDLQLSGIALDATPEFVRTFDVDVEDVDVSSLEVLKALATGGAAVAAVGTFATASTGTAIGALSGAAPTNATLAWLGGGAVAAGGGGMAAGMVVLGGIVALPVLAVGGLVVHHKGRQALVEAKEDAVQAEVTIRELETARTVARGIRLRAAQMTTVVEQLGELCGRRNEELGRLVGRNDDYSAYDDDDRRTVMLAMTAAETLRAVMDVPVIDDQGTLTRASGEAIKAGEQLLAETEQARF